MEDEGTTRLLAVFAAFMIAALMVAGIMLHNLFTFNLVASSLADPKYRYEFPTPAYQIPAMLTPLVIPTQGWFGGLYDLSTPTPVEGDLIITTP